jgi:hypothetical protein
MARINELVSPAIIISTFVLALGVNATVGENKTNELILPVNGTISQIQVKAKTGPIGADLIFDLNVDGISIWNINQNNRLKIEDGQLEGDQTLFDITTLSEWNIFTVDIDQVGSIVPGKTITIILTIILS